MEFTDENPLSRNHRGHTDPHPCHLRDRANHQWHNIANTNDTLIAIPAR
jgi:hypothetical protein